MGSKMNRSHSTPDLAQVILVLLVQLNLLNFLSIKLRFVKVLQVEQDQSLKVPSYERALKPINSNTRLIPRPDLSRNRNFDPVYGSMVITHSIAFVVSVNNFSFIRAEY